MALTPATTYWNRIRTKINELSLLPRNISQEIYDVTQAIKGALSKKDEKTVLKLRQYRARLFRKEPEALKVSQLISKYYDKWNTVFGEKDGLGVVFAAALGIAGISALAFVATKGLTLYKEFISEKRIMEAVKSKALTIQQARELIISSKAPKVSTAKTAGVIMKSLNMIPLLLVGGGLWWFTQQRS